MMRTLFLVISFTFIYMSGNRLLAQKSSFGVLKYNAPSGWQQQSRIEMVTYFGSTEDANLPLEIIVYNSQPAAGVPDSSFRKEWQRINGENGNPDAPNARKRYNSNGLRLAVNLGNPVEVLVNNETRYSQMIVFFVNKEMQAVQFLSSGPKDYRSIRPMIENFIENVESAVPLVN